MWGTTASMSNRTECRKGNANKDNVAAAAFLDCRRRRRRSRLPINHGPLATRTWRRKCCETVRTLRRCVRPRELTSCCGTFCGAL